MAPFFVAGMQSLIPQDRYRWRHKYVLQWHADSVQGLVIMYGVNAAQTAFMNSQSPSLFDVIKASKLTDMVHSC